MLQVYRQIFALLSPAEKKRFFLLMGILIAAALAELVGVSAIFILLGVLAEPDRIQGGGQLNWLYETFGFTSTRSFQIVLAAGTFVVFAGTIITKALALYATNRFGEMRNYSLASRILSTYLRQPYTWFLTRNSADAGRQVLSEVQQVVSGILIPSLQVIAGGLVTVAILAFLMWIDPFICLLSAVFIGGGYVAIYFWQRSRLHSLGKNMLEKNKARFRLTTEAMGGFKEVKILGLEDRYAKRFEAEALSQARSTAEASVIRLMPRFALEALSIGFLLALVMVLLVRSDGDLVAIVPTLGAFAFSIMRLLPAAQQIYFAISSIKNRKPVLDQLERDYEHARQNAESYPSASGKVLSPDRRIVLDKVGFSYPNTDLAALRDASITIEKRTTVGIVGGTGAGKTTLIDLILGLLSPVDGEIRIDDSVLTRDNMRSWQRALGYVPQSIFLVDDSIRQNIAFGKTPDQIDDSAVERAARLAALHDFVETELPDGYETVVGERGVRLSGGQRQRIGIARALYSSPSVLILDEATSALDNITERVVMEAVDTMRDEITIVLIAHRLSTVRNCDVIHVMERGTVVASGTYDELLEHSDLFREMAAGT